MTMPEVIKRQTRLHGKFMLVCYIMAIKRSYTDGQDHTKSGGYTHVQRHLSDEQVQIYLYSDNWRVRVIK
jgi:hypothetical protein